MTTTSNKKLRNVLAFDCFTCLAAAAVMIGGATLLAPVTGLPEPLTRAAGIILLPVAALFGAMAAVRHLPRSLALLAVIGNIAWVLASLIVLSVVPVTTAGLAFVIAQAAVVAVLALLEWKAMQTHHLAVA